MTIRYVLEPVDGRDLTPEIIEIAGRVADNYASRERGEQPDVWCKDDLALRSKGFVLWPLWEMSDE